MCGHEDVLQVGEISERDEPARGEAGDDRSRRARVEPMTRARAEAITLGDLLVLAAERFGDQVALAGDRAGTTYAQLRAAAASVGATMIDAGVPRYARVGVQLTEPPQRSVALLAIALAGGVAVALGAEDDAASLAAALDLRALISDAPARTAAGMPVIEIGPAPGEAAGADRWADPQVQLRRLGARLRDPAVIATVDGPRSPRAVLTHEALVRTWRIWALLCGLAPGERLWCSEPPSGLAGVGPLIACLATGATWVPTPSDATLGLIVAGASPSPQGAPDRLLRAYGPVEAGGLACAWREPRSARGDDDPSLCGPPLPGVSIAIGDDDEIRVRGYNLAEGYLGDGSAGRRSLRRGWLHTGDRGQLDEHGRLRLAPA